MNLEVKVQKECAAPFLMCVLTVVFPKEGPATVPYRCGTRVRAWVRDDDAGDTGYRIQDTVISLLSCFGPPLKVNLISAAAWRLGGKRRREEGLLRTFPSSIYKCVLE